MDGISPSAIRWSDDSKKIYFKWNPDKADADVLYAIATANNKPQKSKHAEQRGLTAPNGSWNKSHTQKVYEKNGDLFLENIKTDKITQLTNTEQEETAPAFSGDESQIIFKQGNNLFSLQLNGGQLTQLTNFVRTAKDKKSADGLNDEEKWLKKQQLELFDIIKKEAKEAKLDSADEAALEPQKLKELVFGNNRVNAVKISSDGKIHYLQVDQSSRRCKRCYSA